MLWAARHCITPARSPHQQCPRSAPSWRCTPVATPPRRRHPAAPCRCEQYQGLSHTAVLAAWSSIAGTHVSDEQAHAATTSRAYAQSLPQQCSCKLGKARRRPIDDAAVMALVLSSPLRLSGQGVQGLDVGQVQEVVVAVAAGVLLGRGRRAVHGGAHSLGLLARQLPHSAGHVPRAGLLVEVPLPAGGLRRRHSTHLPTSSCRDSSRMISPSQHMREAMTQHNLQASCMQRQLNSDATSTADVRGDVTVHTLQNSRRSSRRTARSCCRW